MEPRAYEIRLLVEPRRLEIRQLVEPHALETRPPVEFRPVKISTAVKLRPIEIRMPEEPRLTKIRNPVKPRPGKIDPRDRYIREPNYSRHEGAAKIEYFTVIFRLFRLGPEADYDVIGDRILLIVVPVGLAALAQLAHRQVETAIAFVVEFVFTGLLTEPATELMVSVVLPSRARSRHFPAPCGLSSMLHRIRRSWRGGSATITDKG